MRTRRLTLPSSREQELGAGSEGQGCVRKSPATVPHHLGGGEMSQENRFSQTSTRPTYFQRISAVLFKGAPESKN